MEGFEPSTSLVYSHSPSRPNPNCFPQKNSFSRIFFIQQKVCLQVKTCPSLGVSFFALILASFCVSKSVSVSPVTRGYGIFTLLSSHLISSQFLARDREREMRNSQISAVQLFGNCERLHQKYCRKGRTVTNLVKALQ